jgi:hypothetical protein
MAERGIADLCVHAALTHGVLAGRASKRMDDGHAVADKVRGMSREDDLYMVELLNRNDEWRGKKEFRI